MLLEFLGNRLFEHLWFDDFIQIVLHKRSYSLVHRLRAHLERVADFDVANTGQRVLTRDRFIWLNALNFVVVFRLFEALKNSVGLVFMLVTT